MHQRSDISCTFLIFWISLFRGDLDPLDRLSKRALIAWLNFDPGWKHFYTRHISDYLLTTLADQVCAYYVVAGLSKCGFELPGLWPRLRSGYTTVEYYGIIPTLFIGIYLWNCPNVASFAVPHPASTFPLTSKYVWNLWCHILGSWFAEANYLLLYTGT